MADLFDLLGLFVHFIEVISDVSKKPTIFNVGCLILLAVLLFGFCFIVFAASTAG